MNNPVMQLAIIIAVVWMTCGFVVLCVLLVKFVSLVFGSFRRHRHDRDAMRPIDVWHRRMQEAKPDNELVATMREMQRRYHRPVVVPLPMTHIDNRKREPRA